jgi:spermidine synthase
MRKKSTEYLVLLFFFLSGFCGLVYEVVWMRLLGFVLGNSIYSMATVLAAFMGGLAIGSYIGGRFTDRAKNHLRIYALLQGGIGLYCLCVPFIIEGSAVFYKPFYRSWSDTVFVLTSLRFLIGFLILIVPTAMMGATLPVLSKYFVSRLDVLGWSVGRIYSINTFGAVFGALFSGYVFLPFLGTSRTILVTVILNLIIAVVILLFISPYRRSVPNGVTGDEPSPEPARLDSVKRPDSRDRTGKAAVIRRNGIPRYAILLGYLLSGFAAMVYQVAWTRILIMIIGSSVYAFSLILTSFISGLALGAIVVAPLVDRGRNLLRWFAAIEFGIGTIALVLHPVFGRLPVLFAHVFRNLSESFLLLQIVEFAVIFVLILLPTLLMGAVFPIVSRLFTRELRNLGDSIGKVYASNTIGAIFGSVCGGFVFLPWLGIQNSLFTAVAINFLVGTVLVFKDRTLAHFKRGILTVALPVLLVIAVIFIPRWDRDLITSGVYVYIPHLGSSLDMAEILDDDILDMFRERSEILYYREGVSTTITVKKDRVTGDIRLSVEGKIDASTGKDMNTQELCAHVPMMIHPDPGTVLVIGLASGVTVGSAECYPVEHIDCVEISPAMIEASHYFDHVNRNALADERCNIIIEDGRNHIALTDQMYDVIISEPSNPWISGVATLFTREFFELCRSRLNPDGVICQWVQAYSMDPGDFKAIVRTFREVFPNSTLWEPIVGGDYLLIGQEEGKAIDWNNLSSAFRYPEVKEDLSRIRIDGILAFLSFFVMGPEELEEFAGPGRIHTDDNLFLEYSAPKSMYRATMHSHLNGLAPYRVSPVKYIANLPEETIAEIDAVSAARSALSLAQAEQSEGNFDATLEYLEKGLALAPDLWELRYSLSAILSSTGENYHITGQFQDAVQVMRRVVELDGENHRAHFILARSLHQTGRDDEAFSFAERAVSLDPDNTEYLILQALILASLNRFDRAEELYTKILSSGDVKEESLLFSLVELELTMERTEKASQRLWQIISMDPSSAEAYYNLGNLFAAGAKPDSALLFYRKAISLKEDLTPAHYNEGNLLVEKGFLNAAVKSYRNALSHDGDFTPAHSNLANTLYRLGRLEEAREHYRKVLELDPDNSTAQQGLANIAVRLGSQ